MTDEPLPATERADAESNATDETPTRGPIDGDETDRGTTAHSGEPGAPGRGTPERPDRATDPPPARTGGVDDPDCDRGSRDEGDESDDPDAVEYRLERLRLWRTVVTLAVVVARLVRSL